MGVASEVAHGAGSSAAAKRSVVAAVVLWSLVGAITVLAAAPAQAQMAIQCSDPAWVMYTITLDNLPSSEAPFGVPSAAQAPFGGYVPDGDPIVGQTVIGYDVNEDPVDPAAPQDASPFGRNYQPYDAIGVHLQVIDPGGSCPSVTVEGTDHGVAVVYDSEWDCGTSDADDGCDPHLGSPSNQCPSNPDPPLDPFPGYDTECTPGSPVDCGENCDAPDKDPVGVFPADLVTNLLVVQEHPEGEFSICPRRSPPSPPPPPAYCPDDCEQRGTVVVTFTELVPVEVLRTALLDFGGADALTIDLYSDLNRSTLVAQILDTEPTLGEGSGVGNNVWAEIDLQQEIIEDVCGAGATLADCDDTEKAMMRSIELIDFVFSGKGALDSLTFCYEPEQVPVTLSSFESRPTGDGVRFDWQTATELATAGYHLEERVDGVWRRITERIVPSHSTDSTAPQAYEVVVPGVIGETFRIIDVQTDQREGRHGPFELGSSHGRHVDPPRIDWEGFGSEHAAKAEARFHQRPARLSATGGAILLGVSETSLQRVTFDQLAAAGLDLTGVPADQIAVTAAGEPVPIRVVTGEGGPLFGPGSFVELLGEAQETLYTRTNVYRLEVEPALAHRVAVDSEAPGIGSPLELYVETLEVDRNLAYAFSSPTGDPWYDTRMVAYDGSPLTEEFVFEVDHLVPGVHPAALDLVVWGVSRWTTTCRWQSTG